MPYRFLSLFLAVVRSSAFWFSFCAFLLAFSVNAARGAQLNGVAVGQDGALLWPPPPPGRPAEALVLPPAASWNALLVAGAAIRSLDGGGSVIASASRGLGGAAGEMLASQLDAMPRHRRGAPPGAPGEQFGHLTNDELKSALRERHKKTTGNKPELLARLAEAMRAPAAAVAGAGAGMLPGVLSLAVPVAAGGGALVGPPGPAGAAAPLAAIVAGGAASAPDVAAAAPTVCSAALTHGSGCNSCCTNFHWYRADVTRCQPCHYTGWRGCWW